MEEHLETPSRTLYCEDALTWLENHPVTPGTSFVASLPDISEFHGYTLDRWKSWFVDTASLILSRCPPEGVTVFFQSDIKKDALWVDKGYLCQKAAELCGQELLFHKILCRFAPETRTFGRPAYSHLLCFSKSFRPDLSKSTPDVYSNLGDKTWERGMGFEACLLAGRFIKEETSTHTLINPFCGQGGMLAVANALGLNAIGIERSPKRVELAQKIQVDLQTKKWIS